MLEVLNVILDVLGILAIICLGAFVVVLIGDLILSTFDGHEGVFFRKSKKQNNNVCYTNEPSPVHNEPTVVPYYQTLEKEPEPEVPMVKEEVVTTVDFQKAAEEQKMLQSKGFIKEPVKQLIEEPMFTEIEDEEDENELADAIKETTKIALEQIAMEQEVEKQKEELAIVEEVKEEVKEEPKKQEPEIVYIQAPVEEEDPSIKELKKLREDIFSLRRSAFKDLQEVKDANKDNAIQETKREHKRQMNEKLKELDELKSDKDELAAEKEELLKYKNIALDQGSELERIAQENEQLMREVEELRNKKEVIQKPYYSKEYYLKKLESLEAEIKETEKDLRANKREFIPLQRIKKSYDRDQQKLRRKEAIVAKQKIALYGVKSSAKIDPKRKEKLEEEVKVLNELKESVFHCDQVLKQNKDRYPVLEKANKLLTKTYNRLISDLETVKTAIAWYDENEQE
jgi:hypothetical protein